MTLWHNQNVHMCSLFLEKPYHLMLMLLLHEIQNRIITRLLPRQGINIVSWCAGFTIKTGYVLWFPGLTTKTCRLCTQTITILSCSCLCRIIAVRRQASNSCSLTDGISGHSEYRPLAAAPSLNAEYTVDHYKNHKVFFTARLYVLEVFHL